MLRLHASLTDIDRFDIHRSRFPLTQRFSALQQSRLLRYVDVNTGELEGDLAEAWETPDDESYVMLLRRGVRWWPGDPTEGRAFTGEDVRRNIDRQIAGLDADGNPDPLFLRKAQFTRTRAVDLVDDATVVLRTAGPVGGYLASVIAGPWSFLQAPEAWEAFGDGLRDGPLEPGQYTGTGPFQMQRLIPEGLAAFGANSGYFRDGRPHLLAIEFAHLPTAAGQETAYREGGIDIWSPGDPAALDAVLADRPDDRVAEQPLGFPIEVAFSYREGAENPFQDRRLALAVHHALDRHAVLGRAYGAHAGLSGPVPWFAAGWSRDGAALRELAGYRPGLTAAEIDDLHTLAASTPAAGTGLSLTVPDLFERSYPGLAAQAAETLAARLGIRVRPAVARYSRIVEGLGDGSVPLFLGWGPAARDADPTLDLLDRIHGEGPGNWGGFSDPAVDAVLDEMAITVDRAERQRLYRETLEPLLLEAPSWVVNVGHGVQRSLHGADVWLPRFGFGWDGHHFERAWRVS
jgi:peptide/nickel transport system substrate-binding protein